MNGDVRKIRLLMELRKQGISDTKVLSAMERVPRELFVPEAFQDQAYENIALPIGAGQTISQPQIVAEMTTALELGPRLKVLEIGTGSGYQAAVLAHLCRRLYTIERHRTLAEEAERRFAALRLGNVVVQIGDGGAGWPAQAPFDRIIVTAQAEMLPEILLSQLCEGGVMILPIVESGRGQKVVRLRRTANGVERESLMDARFVPLLNGLPFPAEGN
ncbi:MAG: protein-L-isoaspartate(D-aspartate) O-methyltransferase [Proteobacteria bacterium]|nr:protein-L-isoaspartate(D-aspartate) O-methyltransferase [Pseudomonadota bacterium]